MIRGMIAGLLSGVVVSAGILVLISLALPPPSAPPSVPISAPAEVVVAAPPLAPGPVIALPPAADSVPLIGPGATAAVGPDAATDDAAPQVARIIATDTADHDAATLAAPDFREDETAAPAPEALPDAIVDGAAVHPEPSGADMSPSPVDDDPAPKVGAAPAGLVRLDTALPGMAALVVDDPTEAAPPSPAVTPASLEAPPLAEEPLVVEAPPAVLTPSPDRGGADDPADPAARVLPGRPVGRLTDRRPTPGRLPVIGAPPPAIAEAIDGEAVTAPPDDAEVAAADTATALALQRHARPFANPEGRPLFVILLLDDGRALLSPADLPADLPLTLIVDPAAPAAAERAAAWAAAGQEVAVLATALPRSANAADVEIALESLAATLPTVLALVDPVGNALPGDRRHLAAALPALAERGLGLVTGGRGRSNAAGMAGPAGVPATGIFRELDHEDETAPVIRRYLDRATFKAQQDGQVVMLGRLRPATLAAINAWATDPRTMAAVAPAPLSAVLLEAEP